jgi:manganese/iron transport system permease protein
MIEWLLSPLTYTFMQRGMLAALMVGVLCAIVGCYVVLRSMAFLGDALAHAVLPGVAVAYLLQGNLVLGALVAAVTVALGIGVFTREGTIKEDTAIGILFAAALSLGVALISTIQTRRPVADSGHWRAGAGDHCSVLPSFPGDHL